MCSAVKISVGALRLGGAKRGAVPSETCRALEFLLVGLRLVPGGRSTEQPRWLRDITLAEKSPHRRVLSVKRLFSSPYEQFKEAFSPANSYGSGGALTALNTGPQADSANATLLI